MVVVVVVVVVLVLVVFVIITITKNNNQNNGDNIDNEWAPEESASETLELQSTSPWSCAGSLDQTPANITNWFIIWMNAWRHKAYGRIQQMERHRETIVLSPSYHLEIINVYDV